MGYVLVCYRPFSQGLKYVNLSFSTNNVNNPNLNDNNHNAHNHNRRPRMAQQPVVIYCNNMVTCSNSTAYPKNHLNSKGYVRHSGIQNMAMVDSCNTEATIMTSVDGKCKLLDQNSRFPEIHPIYSEQVTTWTQPTPQTTQWTPGTPMSHPGDQITAWTTKVLLEP